MDEQFKEQYELDPFMTGGVQTEEYRRILEERQKHIQSEIQVRPPNIGYFEKIMYEEDSIGSDTSLVGYTCNFVPQEIVMALGAIPVRLDSGNAAFVDAGNEMIPNSICPSAKALLGVFATKEGIASRCKAVIMPASCDPKRKLAEIINDYKPTFSLQVPSEQNHGRYAEAVFEEFKRMTRFLEEHLNTPLSVTKLYKAVNMSCDRSAIVRQMQAVRTRKPQCLSLRDFYLIIQASLFRPIIFEEYLKECRKTCEWMLAYRPEHKSPRVPLVLSGSPLMWPDFELLNTVYDCGGDIIADTICSGAQSCYDPVVPCENEKNAIFRALVSKYIFSSSCPSFISQSPRLNRLISLVEENAASGVINFHYPGCHLFAMEDYRMTRILAEKNIPLLTLVPGDDMKTKIEEFLHKINHT